MGSLLAQSGPGNAPLSLCPCDRKNSPIKSKSKRETHPPDSSSYDANRILDRGCERYLRLCSIIRRRTFLEIVAGRRPRKISKKIVHVGGKLETKPARPSFRSKGVKVTGRV